MLLSEDASRTGKVGTAISQSTRLGSLFRDEIAARGRDDIHGNILLALPVKWQIVSGLLIAFVIAALTMFGSVSYARSDVVSGSLIPNEGALRVIADRPGRVSKIAIAEGEAVGQGAPLFHIDTEPGADAGAGGQKMLDTLAAQGTLINSQENISKELSAAQRAEIAAQIAGVEQELASILAQIKAQKSLIELAQTGYDKAVSIASRGYLSERDMAARREGLLGRTQGLAALTQMQAAKFADLSRLRSQLGSVRVKQLADQAAFENARSELQKSRIRTSGEADYTLSAPIAGTVSVLSVQTGDYLTSDRPALYLVPAGHRLVARLLVPTKSIAFLRRGQTMTLSLDALSSSTKNSIQARVRTISAAPSQAQGTGYSTDPMYVVTADLIPGGMRSTSLETALIAGMTLTGRIASERKTMLQWIFDPLIDGSNR